MLEEEVSCLRDILSNLVLEETAILSDDQKKIEAILEERRLLLQRKRLLNRKKLKDSPDPLSTEDLCCHDQINALVEKIASQKKNNLMLKKRGRAPMRIPLEKKEVKKKKKSLLLEDEPT